MPRRTQYPIQSFYDPGTIGDPETVKHEDYWQPFSEPVRRLPGVLFYAALAASGAVYDWGTIGDPERVKIDEWWRPFSEPVWDNPAKQYAAAQAASGMAEPDWGTIGDPETVKIEDFWQPWSEPVRLRPNIAYLEPALTYVQHVEAVAADTSTEWWQPFSEPVAHVAHVAHWYESLTYVQHVEAAPAADTSTEWWQPWPEPIWHRVQIAHLLEASPYFVHEQVQTPAGAPEPVRKKRRIYDKDFDPRLPTKRITLDELKRLGEVAQAEGEAKTPEEAVRRVRRSLRAGTSTSAVDITTAPAIAVNIPNIKELIAESRKPKPPEPFDWPSEAEDEEALVMILLEVA